jgi:hypothetical protein
MVAGVPQEERVRIDAVERRLAHNYAQLPHDHVAAVIQCVYARFNQSTVRDYVPLLVERGARHELNRAAAALAAVAEAPAPAAAGTEIIAARHKPPKWRSVSWPWISARFAPDPIGSERF